MISWSQVAATRNTPATSLTITFPSRTLTPSERNYAQIKYNFLCQEVSWVPYGQKFLLVTNHKPSLAILGPKKKFHRWQAHVYSDGQCHTLHTNIRSNLGQQMNMQMLMACLVCHYQLTLTKPPYQQKQLFKSEALPITSSESASATMKDARLFTYVWRVFVWLPDRYSATCLRGFLQALHNHFCAFLTYILPLYPHIIVLFAHHFMPKLYFISPSECIHFVKSSSRASTTFQIFYWRQWHII